MSYLEPWCDGIVMLAACLSVGRQAFSRGQIAVEKRRERRVKVRPMRLRFQTKGVCIVALVLLLVAVPGCSSSGVTVGRPLQVRWSSPHLVHDLIPLASCASSTWCMGMDFVSRYVIYDGRSWSQPRALPVYATTATLSCAGRHFCVAEESGLRPAQVETYSDRHWSGPVALNMDWGPISCASRDLCVTISSDGLASVFDGKTWARPRPLAGLRGPLLPYPAVSCIRSGMCMVVADGFSGARFFVYSGTRWTSTGTLRTWRRVSNGFIMLSCGSSHFCLAALSDGRFMVYDGSQWSRSPRIGADRSMGFVAGLSCDSHDRCIVMMEHGDMLVYENGLWHRSNGPPGGDNHLRPSSLTCAALRMCLLTGWPVYTVPARSFSSPEQVWMMYAVGRT